MPSFGDRSQLQLMTCHPDLKRICKKLIIDFDFSVVCGHRSEEAQNEAFETGHSTVKYPNSKHNQLPSLAVDLCPWPEGYSDHEKFYLLAGRFLQIADDLGIDIRWGGDWDSDDDLRDQTFQDQGHFELVDIR